MRNYEKVRLHLYFANESGDRLVDTYRNVVYNSNMPMERLIVEQVIQGTDSGFAFPTLNPETKVISVTTRDNICYVNLDRNFQSEPYRVSPEVAVSIPPRRFMVVLFPEPEGPRITTISPL